MDASLTSLTAWSYGLAAAGYAAFGLRLALGFKGGLQGIALLAAVAATVVWGLAGTAFALTGSAVAFAASGVADILRYGGWYLFLLLAGRLVANRDRPRASWLMPIAVALIAWGIVAASLPAGRSPLAGDPDRFATFDALAAAVFGLVLVEQLLGNVSEESRWAIKPLCLGLGGVFIFDIYLFADILLFNRLDNDVWSVRGFAHLLALPLIALSTARMRDGTFRIALSRHVMFRSTALMMSGGYLLFMAAAGYYVRYFGGEWGRALQVALLFAGLLVLGLVFFSGSVRAKLRVLVSKHFFSYRYDYREEWLRFTQALASSDRELELGQHVVKGLADLVESPAGGLWTRDESARCFAPAAMWNLPRSEGREPVDGSLASFLEQTGWVVNLEEYRVSPERYRSFRLPAWLQSVPNVWLIVPLTMGNALIGFVVLATARTPVEVNWEVNDLLKTAARQAATFLAQTQATEALLETRKFDAFNRMSAFVVHDLKNIVAQLSLMLKNVERHRDNPEFQEDMLVTVQHSVERMKQMMLQLRDGTTPVNAPRGVDVAKVVTRVVNAKSGQSPTPALRAVETVVAKGHEDRLERVIGHVVQNAIDATARNGHVWVSLTRCGDRAAVEVEDNGHGMTPEFVRDRLFKPFQTTKETGMGIGAYESFQYVRELGGQVEVESAAERGTRIRLLLPLAEDSGALPAVEMHASNDAGPVIKPVAKGTSA